MCKTLQILILDDVATDAELMIYELQEAGLVFQSMYVADKPSFLQALEKEQSLDIILSDYSLPSFDGLSALKMARERRPEVPFIFVSGALGEEMAIELLKRGATDYVLKGRLARLAPAVSRALLEVEERTERKRAENALKESEIRYRTIFENTGTAMIIVEEDMMISLANKQFEQLSGFTRQEIEGKKNWKEFVHHDDLPRANGFDQREATPVNISSAGYEFRIINRNGEIVHTLANIALVPSTKKNVLTFLDITKLKQVEREKREAALYASSMIEASLDPLVTINADGRIMNVNRATELATGLPRESLIGSEFANYFTDPQKANEGYLEVFAQGFIRDYPLEIRHVTGRITNVLYNASLYRNEAGEIQGIFAAARDITERLEAEKIILISNERLRSLTSELVMTEERERRRIAVDLHDNIGQTLALTKMKLDFLLDQARGDGLMKPIAEITDMIDQSIQQTRSLMTDLSPSVLYELGLVEAIEWLSEQIQSQHGLKVILKADPRIRKIDTDIQILLFRATRELLLNAVKHARAKEACVIVQKLEENIQVTVKDNGVGFDGSSFDQIDKRSGGFGLFSIRERLKYIGGSFEIETRKGQGACIRLIAPQRQRKRKRASKIDQ